MESERVVEVRFGTESLGSGYLISPSLVLTARHVAPKGATIGTLCTVRPLIKPGQQDLPLREQRRPDAVPAHLAWCKQEKKPDLAIIEIDKPHRIALSETPLVFGRVPLNDMEPRRCSCAGFPEAAGVSSLLATGKINYITDDKEFDLDIESALPRDWETWRGMSGAVVICHGRALAVVRTVDGGFDGKLRATPAQAMVEDEEFQAFWLDHFPNLPALQVLDRVADPLREEILHYAYLLDRRGPLETVRTRVKALTSASRVYSQIILVEGLEEDMHGHFIQQIAEDSRIQVWLDREANAQSVIVNLPWPDYSPIDADDAFREIVSSLYRAANLPVPRSNEEPAASRLRDSFERGMAPRAFWTHMRRSVARADHCRLLRLLIEFWASLDKGSPVLLFVCVSTDAPPAPAGGGFFAKFRAAPPREADLIEALSDVCKALHEQDRVLGLDPLEPITTLHVGPWLDAVKFRCTMMRQAQIDALRVSLCACVGEGLRIGRVEANLLKLLAEI